MGSALLNLFKSRKFLLLLLDTLWGAVLWAIVSFRPDFKDSALFLWGIWQPAVVAVIIGITVEDSALKAVGAAFDKQLSALGALFQSRKFLLMLLDAVVATVLFVGATYYPGSAESVKFFVGLLQPVVVLIIVGISVEDGSEIRANGK